MKLGRVNFNDRLAVSSSEFDPRPESLHLLVTAPYRNHLASVRNRSDQECSGPRIAPGSNSWNEECPLLTHHSLIVLSLSELAITETELKLIAAAAIIGFSSSPNAGNSTPAASGTPTAL